jgi:hypothetical protein
MSARPDYAWRTADNVLRAIDEEDKRSAAKGGNGSAPDALQATTETTPTRRQIQVVSGTELLEMDIEPPQMLIEDLWSMEGCGYLTGEPKCLKTYTIFDMALAIVTGGSVFGRFQVMHTGPVVAFLEETKPGEAQQRLHRLMQGRGIEPDQVADLHLAVQNRVRIDDVEDQEQIRELARKYKPLMIFLDPLARMREGSENQTEDMNAILGFLRGLQVDFHTAVALTHHLTKPDPDAKENVRTGHRIRGTGDQYAWMDSALYFTRIRESDRVQVEVEHRETAEPDPFTIGLEVEGPEAGGGARLEYQPGRLLSRGVVEACSQVLAALGKAPGGLKAREVQGAATTCHGDTQQAVRHLEQTGQIVVREETRSDGQGKNRRCKIHYLAGNAPPATGD